MAGLELDVLLSELRTRRGSALHLAGGHPPLLRVGLELTALEGPTLDAEELERVLLGLLTEAQRTRLTSQLDLELVCTSAAGTRVRASLTTTREGVGAVLRLLPSRAATLTELDAPEVLFQLADRRSGLFVAASPPHAGASEVVAAMVAHINRTRACHVLMLEDPIETVHEPLRAQVTQREIGAHVPDLCHALRNAPREDADVIVTGELASEEAVRLAVSLAQSGALVLSTVPAGRVVRAIDRMIARFGEPEQASARSMLADTLVGVVAQQMIRAGAGVDRVVAQEVLVASPAASAVIRDGKTSELTTVMQASEAQGSVTLDRALERLVAEGRIEAEEASARASDREALTRRASARRAIAP